MKVTMNNAYQSFLHVSQNIPTKSEMMVKMREPRNTQIHVSQAVPRSSPLSWKLEGDPQINQVSTRDRALYQVTVFFLRSTWLKTLQTTKVL